MADRARPSDDHPRQRALHAGADDGVTPDNSKISLTLRPAEFDDEPRESPPATGSSTSSSASPHVGTSRQFRVHGYATPIRSTIVRRELVELAGNPFVDPHGPRADGQPSFRQDIYPAYDASGRRIGLEHVRNASVASETKGYYRRHVHEYDNARGTPLPLPSSQNQNRQTPQIPVQSSYPEHGPLPPVSAVIAGISHEPQYGVTSFSHIQNKPRSPHEILGLPPDAPLNLWSLLDPETPDAKPQYNYHVLVKLAILGNKGQKATLQDILRAIRMRFPYYDKLPKQEAIAFGNSIRHLLSLLAAFVREPKPVTEPGKGAYWRVDFSRGEGNKRVRKRNKPQKKSRNADKQDNQDEKDEESDRSGSEEPSPPSAQSSTQESSRSPTLQSPIDSHPGPRTPKPRGGGRGGRKPAPKNLITTPNGSTTIVSMPPVEAPQNDFHARIDPALRDTPGAAAQSYGPPPHEPYLQLYPSSVGAHRERPVRGAARSAPYPSALAIPKDSSRHVPEGGSQRYASDSPVDMRYRNEHHSNVSQGSGDSYLPHEYQRNHHSVSAPSVLGGYDQNGYAPHHSFNPGGHRDDASSKESSSSGQNMSPTYSEQRSQPSSANSHYSTRFSHSPTTYQMTPSSTTSYGPPQLSIPIPSSAGSVPGPSSSVSSGGSYGIPPHMERRPTSETDMFNGVHQTHTEYHEDESRAGSSAPWNSARSTPHPVELSARF